MTLSASQYVLDVSRGVIVAFATTALVLAVPLASSAQANAQSNPVEQVPFVEAERNQAAKLKNHRDAVYRFNVGGFLYTVTGRGVLSVRSPKSGAVLAKTPLDFPVPAFISGIRYLMFNGDLILNYDVTLIDRDVYDGNRIVQDDVLQGRVARFTPKALKTVWVNISARTDPGTPIAAGNSMFVSGTKMIGEIDLDTGLYLWLLDELLDRARAKFLAFATPRIEGDYAFFEEDRAVTGRRNPETIQVERRTGQIVTMSYKSPER